MQTLCCVEPSIFGGEDENEDVLPNKMPEIKESETIYSMNPPLLYLLIESLEWDEVRSRCSTHPQEIGAWVSCKMPNSDTFRWHHLPIHAALVMKADIRVIKALVEPFPKSLRRKDHLGRLPCHLAIQHDASEAILDYMIKLYPESTSIEDNKGRVPLSWIFEAEEPTVGLRSSIAIYLNIERNKTKEKEQANMEAEVEKIRLQYDENLQWIKNERDKDRQSMEETIKEYEKESKHVKTRLQELSINDNDRSDEVEGSRVKIKESEEKALFQEKELSDSRKKIEELNNIIDDIQNKQHSQVSNIKSDDEVEKLTYDLQAKAILLERNQKKNLELVIDLEEARKKINSLEDQVESSGKKYKDEIQDLKKSIRSAETVKSVMKERLAKLTNSLVNLEHDAQKRHKMKEERT